MEFIKEWTFSICITLVASVLISLLMPSGTTGKYGKLIISLFIFLSILTPFSKADLYLALDEFNEQSYSQSCEESYSKLIETKIKENLSSAGYSGITVSCDAVMNNNEIEIKSLAVYIPDDYDKEEVRNYIYENMGLNTEVYSVGE
ncbi:MAG: hypothetical protein PUE08_00610 [Eubacteriales bacterium]|nr:hypothetical protein [Eubacteriales bacterium]